MKEKIFPFLGGILVGAAIGMLVLPPVTLQLSTNFLILTIATSILTFVGGILLGGHIMPKKEMKLTGRVFEFPQAPIMIEIALKRAKSILATKVTEE